MTGLKLAYAPYVELDWQLTWPSLLKHRRAIQVKPLLAVRSTAGFAVTVAVSATGRPLATGCTWFFNPYNSFSLPQDQRHGGGIYTDFPSEAVEFAGEKFAERTHLDPLTASLGVVALSAALRDILLSYASDFERWYCSMEPDEVIAWEGKCTAEAAELPQAFTLEGGKFCKKR